MSQSDEVIKRYLCLDPDQPHMFRTNPSFSNFHLFWVDNSEKHLDFFLDIVQSVERLEELDNLSPSVEQELREIQRNHVGNLFFFVEKITVVSQPPVNRVSIRPIDVHFFKHGEVGSELTPHKLPNIFVGPWLLIEESIGRKGQHLETLMPEFIVHLGETFVVE